MSPRYRRGTQEFLGALVAHDAQPAHHGRWPARATAKGVGDMWAPNHRLRSGLTALLLAALPACGDVAEPSSTATATTLSTVVVATDISYGTASADRLAPVTDVYSPVAGDRLPVVVLLHGGGLNKDDPQYARIARAVADRGVVVAVPNWGPASGLPPTTGSAQAATDDLDAAACALSYIVAHATEWRGDPTRIVLFGHSVGANVASVLMFTYTRSVGDGCATPAQQWQPQAVVLWDGELAFLDQALFNGYPELPELFAVMTPWSQVAAAIYDGPVHVLATASFSEWAKNCKDMATWTAQRDASGTLFDALARVDAAADGCVDNGEVGRALKEFLQQGAVPADYTELTDPESEHTNLTDADLAQLADILTTWADATVSNMP